MRGVRGEPGTWEGGDRSGNRGWREVRKAETTERKGWGGYEWGLGTGSQSSGRGGERRGSDPGGWDGYWIVFLGIFGRERNRGRLSPIKVFSL